MTQALSRDQINDRLSELGLTLPDAAAPAANYAPFALTGESGSERIGFVSGQLPFLGGELKFTGSLGADVSLEDGVRAAELCGLNCLAQIDAALNGEWSRFDRLVRICGYVASSSDFYSQPEVINGASDLFAKTLGDAGIHARAAVGVSALPRNTPVEVEAIFTFK